MSLPLIEAKGLKKRFPVTKGLVFSQVVGWVKAVDGIDFSIQPVGTLGLVGESGCGKTTVAKLILSLEVKTAGSLLFEGAEIESLIGMELRRYRTSVQTVFQNPYSSLNPRMRVRDIIAEPLEINHVLSPPAIKERVEEVLTLVGLSGEAAGNFYPHEFSGGQRQRIAIGRALSTNARLLVLDEPISALDVSIGAQIMNLMIDLRQRMGLAYLFISHNLATVRYISEQIAIMYLGKIVEQGKCDEVYTHPLHPYTQALLVASLPVDPHKRQWTRLLGGEVASALNPPAGCHFHPRCTFAKPVCREEEPVPQEQAPGHTVACWLY